MSKYVILKLSFVARRASQPAKTKCNFSPAPGSHPVARILARGIMSRRSLAFELGLTEGVEPRRVDSHLPVLTAQHMRGRRVASNRKIIGDAVPRQNAQWQHQGSAPALRHIGGSERHAVTTASPVADRLIAPTTYPLRAIFKMLRYI
jgi:hypothetical protein